MRVRRQVNAAGRYLDPNRTCKPTEVIVHILYRSDNDGTPTKRNSMRGTSTFGEEDIDEEDKERGKIDDTRGNHEKEE